MLLGKLISISTTSLFLRMAGSHRLQIDWMMGGIMTYTSSPVKRRTETVIPYTSLLTGQPGQRRHNFVHFFRRVVVNKSDPYQPALFEHPQPLHDGNCIVVTTPDVDSLGAESRCHRVGAAAVHKVLKGWVSRSNGKEEFGGGS